ncbi:unnamed protein product [Caenorhabditis auriculariae]|uniref:Uncharacterized protein n=1 Tax=Caenorhabditis auriculariae TaxID=2777116 RepID=A0A8S1HF74_9PELO|nr:unnamed protein product [Caenorhabditis auriculariae]
MSNGNMEQYITNGENLDEELSVLEFIKTLKRVESNDTIQSNGRESAPSGSTTGSTNDLLQSMRKRFVHRATEPIFHALEQHQVGSKDANSVPKAPTAPTAPAAPTTR